MTERIHSITVALSSDMREDDAQALIQAIGLMRGVAGVKGNVADANSFIAVARFRTELGKQIVDLIYDRKPN